MPESAAGEDAGGWSPAGGWALAAGRALAEGESLAGAWQATPMKGTVARSRRVMKLTKVLGMIRRLASHAPRESGPLSRLY